ncbi:MAG: DsbC family protein [Pseudomonadales bacterium]|nr:DsbC family protein [Pseudomonadales bacterium]
MKCGMLLALCLLFTTTFAVAADENEVLGKLKQARPDLTYSNLQKSVLPGFWEVEINGGQKLYVTEDGSHFIVGDLFRIDPNRFTNLSEEGRNIRRKTLLDQLDEKDMVVFKPYSGDPKAVLTVFTDIDCTFCRKLHQEVPELNRRGIEVRYLAYPRAGIDSASYDKIVSAWCADNPQMALTKAKSGTSIPPLTCDNPVAEQYELGGEMGVTGTPTLILEDGSLISGYMPADALSARLGIN